MRAWEMGWILLLLLGSGCIGGGAETVAKDFATIREQAVPAGLLVPSDQLGQENYRQSLIAFRTRVNMLGGGEREVLNTYLDGSLSLVDMVSFTNEGFSLLENVNLDFIDCTPNAPASKAIVFLEDAREAAQSAQGSFETVQQNPTLTNALGADYVLNAASTTRAIVNVHGERVKELKTACGFSV